MRLKQAALAAVLLVMPSLGGAATVNVNYTQFNSNAAGVTAALAARDAYIGTGTVFGEDFEGFTACPAAGCASGTITTGLGTFTGVGPAPGAAGGSQVDPLGNIVVRTSVPSPFGRVNVTPGGANWLDSNDLAGILWNLVIPNGQHASKIAFLLSDLDDVGKVIFRITVGGVGLDTFVAPRSDSTATIGDGKLHLVMLDFGGKTSDLSIEMFNGTGDGFGIDGIRVSAVPLPAGGLLLIGALAGLGALRRRSRR